MVAPRPIYAPRQAIPDGLYAYRDKRSSHITSMTFRFRPQCKAALTQELKYHTNRDGKRGKLYIEIFKCTESGAWDLIFEGDSPAGIEWSAGNLTNKELQSIIDW